MQSKVTSWIGRILSTLVVLLMLMGAFFSFRPTPESTKEGERMGWSKDRAPVIGCLALGSAVIYAIPQTAVLGAILLTGYLGGATATHVRIGDPWFMPVIVGIVVWLGLFLREPRLRSLVPIRK